MAGEVKDTDIELESDGVAIKEGYVSISPLQLQMTNFDFIDELTKWSF
jgi:broad specificity polyphosphatase/5'/3'-nucleotidase SurE